MPARRHGTTAPLCRCWSLKRISTRASAQALGLDFVPLATKQYDLLVLHSHLALPHVQSLIEMLGQSAFRWEPEAATSYDMHLAGNRLL
jgi:molybdate-binding protein